jgi:hypothetical protein
MEGQLVREPLKSLGLVSASRVTQCNDGGLDEFVFLEHPRQFGAQGISHCEDFGRRGWMLAS